MKPRIKIESKDHGWNAMMDAVKAARKQLKVKVGVLADTEKGGLHEEGGTLTVAEIAVVNEFGTEDGHVPARSFVRSTFDEQRDALKETAAELLVDVLFGEKTTRQALGLLGADLAAKIKNKITQGDGVPPPNAPSTVAAKGSDRPLVNTGRMLNAITWQVEGEEPETSGGSTSPSKHGGDE